MTLLCLKVKHPQLRLDDVSEIYVNHDADKIAAATWDLWGFYTEKKNPADGHQPGSPLTGENSPTLLAPTQTDPNSP